jgi:hypothetical protein
LQLKKAIVSIQGYKPKEANIDFVTARTKCYSIDEGSSVDCTIEDTKLQKEEQEGRESRGLKGLCSSDMKH